MFRRAKGFRGAPGRRWRLVKETVLRADANATRDRRRRKRDFRALWVTRLTAACRMRGISYSRFIYGLTAADIEINRKMLSEIAIHDPETFDKIVEQAKAALEAKQAA